MYYYQYVVLMKGKEFLAVLTNSNTHWELGHYYEQEFAFFMEVSAFNASSAIEIAKQNETSEIVKLQAELSALRQENQNLLSENSRLKYQSRFGRNYGTFDSGPSPFDILGFSSSPNQEELKKRYRQLAQKLHPDRGGTNLLMQMCKTRTSS
jgi:DnaJ-domain-containing protein 1